jgi:hypothetical protein
MERQETASRGGIDRSAIILMRNYSGAPNDELIMEKLAVWNQ